MILNRRYSKQERDQESEEGSAEQDESEKEVRESEPEEEEEDKSHGEDDGDQEEEYTPRTAARITRRITSSVTPKRSPAKARKIIVGRRETDMSKKKAPRKAVNSAVATFAKRFLDKNETPEHSLVAALLHCSPRKQEASSQSLSALRKHMRGKETPYTSNLIETAMHLIDEHQHDPNAAQVGLYNLLFRSVGATYESLLDPADVDLENISDEDMTEYVLAVVQSMEETPLEQVLLLAENTPGTKVPVAAREYHAIYREFWYLLGVTALSDSLSGNCSTTHKRHKTSKKEDDDEEEEDCDDEANDTSQAPQGFRFQIETIREILKRMIELSCLTQDDLRAGTTIAVYELSVAILERTVELREKLGVAQRQLHVAKKSRMKRKAEALESQKEVWNRMCTELEELVTGTVTGMFMKRYKDIHPHIRAESMHSMSRFVVIRPDIFLKNAFLKYMGWMLSDKTAIVRVKAIEGLLAPFKANQELLPRNKRDGVKSKLDTSLMAGIAEKFAQRLSDCGMDVDLSVQERAMELLLAFSRDGLLDSITDQDLWKQINDRALAKDTSASVRRTGLLFVLEQLEAFDSDSIRSESDIVERINALASW